MAAQPQPHLQQRKPSLNLGQYDTLVGNVETKLYKVVLSNMIVQICLRCLLHLLHPEVLTVIFRVQKIFDPPKKCFWLKKIFGRKKKFWSKKIFGQKIFWVKKKVWVKKYLG